MPQPWWDIVDWQAWATLVTGLAAVGGAVYVGKKQVAITNRQADIAEGQTRILARQTEMHELALRKDLFDRRYEVFEAFREQLLEVVLHGSTGTDEESREQFRRLSALMVNSRFHFRPETFKRIQELWDTLHNFRIMCETEHLRAASRQQEFVERHEMLKAQIKSDYRDLYETFGEEMRLYTSPMPDGEVKVPVTGDPDK